MLIVKSFFSKKPCRKRKLDLILLNLLQQNSFSKTNSETHTTQHDYQTQVDLFAKKRNYTSICSNCFLIDSGHNRAKVLSYVQSPEWTGIWPISSEELYITLNILSLKYIHNFLIKWSIDITHLVPLKERWGIDKIKTILPLSRRTIYPCSESLPLKWR